MVAYKCHIESNKIDTNSITLLLNDYTLKCTQNTHLKFVFAFKSRFKTDLVKLGIEIELFCEINKESNTLLAIIGFHVAHKNNNFNLFVVSY